MKEMNNGLTGNNKPPFRQRYDDKTYTLLNADRTRILNEIKDKPFFEPCPVRDRKPKGG